jgi:putative hydrolase of the HAD superfamily
VNNLDAKDTVFIDDVDVNIQAAAKVGLHTIQFQNAAQCERELRALGVSL